MAAPTNLARRLESGVFAITAEVTPPVAGGPETLLEKSRPLKGLVDAVNVTDGASARVHMSSLAAAALLQADGVEPVIQFTCRDRNRIALMSDLLGAAALGIKNALILTGDDPTQGDQPLAKPVFDLSSGDLLSVARAMTEDAVLPSLGVEPDEGAEAPPSRPIDTPPNFYLGAADMPTAEPNDKWLGGLKAKAAAGAKFIQTQFCYDMDVVRDYAGLIRENGFDRDLHFLVGNGPLLSARSALWMRKHLWGVIIPDDIIERLEAAEDPKAEGIALCIDQLRQMAEIDGIDGAHLMAPINTGSIPAVIEGAGIEGR